MVRKAPPLVILNGAWTGIGNVSIVGNTTTPANVILSTTASDLMQARNGAVITISGCEIRTTTSGVGLHAVDGARIIIGAAVRFGACADYHALAERFGTIYSRSNYSIVGSAGTGHMGGTLMGLVDVAALTVTVTGALAFFTFVLGSRGSNIQFVSVTFAGTGTVTALRYHTTVNAVVFTAGGGANYFPGTSAGYSDTGGQYA